MRVLVCGAGAFGCEHLARLALRQGIALAVADPHPGVAEAAAARFGLAAHATDAEAAMDAWRPDAVIVAAAPAAHPALVRAALGRGLPVLVEKPAAPSAEAALQLLEAEAASGAFAMPGHVLRFSSPHRVLAALVADGRIGRPVAIDSRRYRDAGHAERYAAVDPVPMTMIHDIDLALWIAGAPAVAGFAVRAPEPGPRSATLALLRDARGAAWRLATAWLHPSEAVPPDRIEVLGTEGSAELVAGGALTLHGPGGVETIPVPGDDDPLATEQTVFLEAVRSGRAPAEISLRDSLEGLRAVELILTALRDGPAAA